MVDLSLRLSLSLSLSLCLSLSLSLSLSFFLFLSLSRSGKNPSHELWIGAEVKRRKYDRDIQWTDYKEDQEETKVTLLCTQTKVSNESIVFDFGVVPCERTGTATSFNLDTDKIAKAVKTRDSFEFED